MNKTTKKTGYEILAMIGFGTGVFFLSEIGMHYDNIGSRTGVIISVFLILYSLLGMKPEPRTRTERLFLKLGKPLGALLTVTAIATIAYMIFAVPKGQPGKDAVVVILGSGVNSDGSPSEIMQKRVDAAVEYLKNHDNEKIIVSGGQLGSAPVSEAESMKQALIKEGIEEDRIICEDQSRTTKENLEYSADIIAKNGLSKNIVLVTSEFHLARACEFARRNGLNPIPVKAETPWYCLPAYAVREMYSIIACYLFR